jgi:hypothetical protein
MRLLIVLATLLFAIRAPAENFLLKAKGLGAAAAADVAVTAGAMAFSDPPKWQGYGREGDTLNLDGMPAANSAAGDCAVSDGNSIAKALMAQNGVPPGAVPPTASLPSNKDGQIHLTEPDTSHPEAAYDSKAIYQAGQPISCARK